ncbi:hypothetical protein [Dongia rigui]|uniref:Uncharacterized protein n=1 Tax=Dongia rigui TaxID=940149 RepID=A0ABU5DWR6_9PROT|nr:hypothetical protein [Dongia rigui]MDY0871750.1 hypothetical protein [Dongia rigui]
MVLTRSSRLLPIMALICGAMLAACTPSPTRVNVANDETLRIAHSVWENFEAYKLKLGRGGGVFVVTEDGLASGYSYCPGDRCRPGSFTQHALQLCENAGMKCIVFAFGTTIKVDYEIVD